LEGGRDLVTDEMPVLFHNDFQSQNLIVQGNPQEGLTLAGVIDFDNWRIGPEVQDFVKMYYWTIRGRDSFAKAFLEGYSEIKQIPETFEDLLQIYELLWLVLVHNFEIDKIKKVEQNAMVDARFPAVDEYLVAIQALLGKS
jgi:aminoglycoside phosphotransferase (APT) family kinase protein